MKTNGRRGRTRTCDPLLRRQMLYPPELRAHILESITYITPVNRVAYSCVQNRLHFAHWSTSETPIRRAQLAWIHPRVEHPTSTFGSLPHAFGNRLLIHPQRSLRGGMAQLGPRIFENGAGRLDQRREARP